MFIRQERSFVTGSVIANQAIDVTTYDKGGRYDGVQAVVCPSNAIPQFIFAESADAGDPVSVCYLGNIGTLSLKMKGTGVAGNKITLDSSGRITASATAANAALGTYDFGIALADWTDGEEINCMMLRGCV